MQKLDRDDRLFVFTSFIIQLVLLVYFAIRKLNFDLGMEIGWIVYILAVPALFVSLVMILHRKPWHLWLGGFLFTLWAGFGFLVDRAWKIEWRFPIYWPVFVPYILLYLAALMFYWWPLGRLRRVYWYIYAILFLVSTYLNVTSHAW